MEIFSKGILKMRKQMGMECLFIKKEVGMRVFGRMTFKKELEKNTSLMAQFTKENIKEE